MAVPDSFGSLEIRSTCNVHSFVILDHCPGCIILELSKILPNSYFRIAPHSPALTILLDFFFLSILPLCPLGTPVSWQTVLYPQSLHQMFLLPPCPNLYSPLLFLNHYSFSFSDNCSFEAYAVSLHLSFINISSCVNFSLWFISHLPGSGRKKNGHMAGKMLKKSMEYYLEGRIRSDMGKVN